MIISCNNCNKRFEINSDLIPDSGRLLMCSNCNSQWFYKKKETTDKPVTDGNNIKIDISKNNLDNKNNSNDFPKKKKREEALEKTSSNNILYKILVFLISIIALIIFVDTFKSFIGLFIPNIEFIFYNLYESIKDIMLFLKDLLK